MNEYILLAGYRRYNACKKLGWKKIDANIYRQDKVISIPLDQIELGDNSRKDEKSNQIAELMESIKQNGLIQPIVVALSKDLSEEDFIALNLTENIQRKDLTPLETSIRLKRLISLGLNVGEIAVRMGIPRSKAKKLLDLSNGVDESQLLDVRFSGSGNKAVYEGKVSFTIASYIANARISSTDKAALMSAAKDGTITFWSVEVITRLINQGMTVKQAMVECKDYKVISPKLVVKADELDRLMSKYGIKSYSQLCYGMLNGEIPLQKSLYFRK